MKRIAIYPVSFVILFLLALVVAPAVAPTIQGFAREQFGYGVTPIIKDAAVRESLEDGGFVVLWIDVKDSMGSIGVRLAEGGQVVKGALGEAVSRLGASHQLSSVALWVWRSPPENDWVAAYCAPDGCQIVEGVNRLNDEAWKFLMVETGWVP